MKVEEEYEDGGDGHSVGVGRMCGRIDGLAGGQAKQATIHYNYSLKMSGGWRVRPTGRQSPSPGGREELGRAGMDCSRHNN